MSGQAARLRAGRRRGWRTLAPPDLLPILLLVGSNLFMPLAAGTVASWLIAFVEY